VHYPSLDYQLPPANRYNQYGGSDNIGYRKHNSAPVYPESFSVSSEQPIPHQENFHGPYSNLIPEYQNIKGREVSNEHVITHPYYDNVYLPEMTISSKKDISSSPAKEPPAENPHISISTKIHHPPVSQIETDGNMIRKLVSPPSKSPKRPALNHPKKNVKRITIPSDVKGGNHRKIPIRKKPIQPYRKKSEQGSIWSDLSRFATTVIDVGQKGLLALGSEENYQYADIDYSSDTGNSQIYSGRNF
jgi:hypothetical protein